MQKFMQCRENYLIRSVLSTRAILRLKIRIKMIITLRPEGPERWPGNALRQDFGVERGSTL
jgi:hypothetical protein